MKTCTMCNIEKDDSEFYKSKRWGLHSWCKACTILNSRERNAAAYIKRRGLPNQYGGRGSGDSILQFRNTELKNKSACSIIRNHHEQLKDDPERLSTEFLKSVISVDCKKNNKEVE